MGFEDLPMNPKPRHDHGDNLISRTSDSNLLDFMFKTTKSENKGKSTPKLC